MTLFQRMRRLLRASLDEALNRVEDPVVVLNGLLLEMSEHLERAREQVAVVMAMERRLTEQAREADEVARQCTTRARRALERGAEEPAREALWQKLAAEALAQQYRAAQAEQARDVARLRSALAYLEERLREARVVRARLLARAATARAEDTVSVALRETTGEEAYADFARVARRIGSAQRRVRASPTIPDGEKVYIDAERDAAVEQELRMLKHAQSDPPALSGDERRR